MGIRGVSGEELRAFTSLSQRRAPQPEGVEGEASGSAPNSIRAVPERTKELSTRPEKRNEEAPGADGGGTRLRIDQATERIVAQIVNQSNEVIKQIPPEELLRLIAKTRQIQGLLFDQLA